MVVVLNILIAAIRAIGLQSGAYRCHRVGYFGVPRDHASVATLPIVCRVFFGNRSLGCRHAGYG